VFRRTGLERLFPVTVGELVGRSFDARSVVGPAFDELEGRLAEGRSFSARVRIADAFLSRRVPETSAVDRIGEALRLVDASRGTLPMTALASAAGLGPRQFERTFKARLGMRPKLYARIVRFQAALDRKARSAESWTRVAQELGYHDQMHLVHDFAQFSTGTPTETLRVLEGFFREQLALMQEGVGASDARLVPRFVI
jgi:AraC-like DNA-binding protein